MTNTWAQQGAPVLRYDAPPNFSRSAITPPDDYSSNEFNASLQVYPFRPFSGDIAQMFQKTLLREWIDARFQESGIGAPPELRSGTDRAGHPVLSAQFVEANGGRLHLRMVIVAGQAAAIVDASASGMQTWQRAWPAFTAVGASLRVDAASPPAATLTESPAPAGRSVPGLYVARTMKDAVDVNRAPGFNMMRVPALLYYLFSADGRVYRVYDSLALAAGNPGRFDFDAAQRADPDNSGRYTIRGKELHIQLGGRSVQTIVTTLPEGGRLTIENEHFERK
jgi:hypothetical protein